MTVRTSLKLVCFPSTQHSWILSFRLSLYVQRRTLNFQENKLNHLSYYFGNKRIFKITIDVNKIGWLRYHRDSPVGLIYMSIDLFFLRDLRAVNKPMFVFLIRFCLRPKRNNLERPQRLEDRVSETALCKRNSREYDHNCRTVQPNKIIVKRVFGPSTIVVKLNPRNNL